MQWFESAQLIILLNYSSSDCPMLDVLSFALYHGIPVLATLPWHSCPRNPIIAVLFCTFIPVLFWLSRPGLAVLFWLSFCSELATYLSSLVLVAMSWQPWPGSPVLSVPFYLSSFACPVFLSCSAFPVLSVLFWMSHSAFLSCSTCPVLNIPFCLYCSACPGPPVQFFLSCSAFPVLPFLCLVDISQSRPRIDTLTSCTVLQRGACLLKQQSSITVYRLPT